ncbi:MAG: sensor histidine kinase [Oscillospiraceae bacterium]|nr:sensor histidine kinase [Oscillospiraceae bacterium]
MKNLIKRLVLLLICCGVFWVVFYLSDVPVASAGYAAIICAVIIIVSYLFDLYLYRRRLNRLREALARLPDELPELPAPAGGTEKSYQETIYRLKYGFDELTRCTEADKRETLDYYTMWVHQIKTPISAIHLMLQSGQAPLSELENELFRIEQYVEMALGYQRLSGIGSDLVLRRQSLDSIVRQCIRKYARSFIRKKLKLEYDGTEALVLTDEKWLCFVLEQLLSNALKYTPSGTITITAAKEQLTVSDTGIGIRPEELPRIFERGYTGYNGHENKSSTGIGLYLCKKVCDMLGHDITIDYKPGNGTSVTVIFHNIEIIY